jgi:ABC-type multidrug transport system ATPase subunit
VSASVQPVAAARELSVGYAGRTVATIPDIDFLLGGIWNVIGANGSGKTTLLKTLAGLLPPAAGRVERRCRRGRHGAIYVHSVPYLFAGSVRRNLSLVHTDRFCAESAAAAFGLADLLERDALTLSHGQQRRLALARAVAGQPSFLLVDEPEGGLDDEGVAAWRAYLAEARGRGGPAIVVATHRPLDLDHVAAAEVRL